MQQLELLLSYLNTPFVTLFLLITTVCLLVSTILLSARLNKLFKGKDAASLEPLIHEVLEKMKDLSQSDEDLRTHAIDLDKRLSQSVRNVSTLRFKAFEAGASNQSFAIALLDEKGNGVVMSSLHNRDRVTTYAKPIKAFKSTYELTEEELHTIEESKKANNR
jgi:HAMP domain-containing protein